MGILVDSIFAFDLILLKHKCRGRYQFKEERERGRSGLIGFDPIMISNMFLAIYL